MPSYYVPLERYPETYNGQPLTVAALASQKNYMSLYVMGVYGDAEAERWLSKAFRDAGKRLDMGKCCVRFKALDELPLDVIGEVIGRLGADELIARYEASRGGSGAKARGTKAGAASGRPAGARSAKKTAAKKAAKTTRAVTGRARPEARAAKRTPTGNRDARSTRSGQKRARVSAAPAKRAATEQRTSKRAR